MIIYNEINKKNLDKLLPIVDLNNLPTTILIQAIKSRNLGFLMTFLEEQSINTKRGSSKKS